MGSLVKSVINWAMVLAVGGMGYGHAEQALPSQSLNSSTRTHSPLLNRGAHDPGDTHTALRPEQLLQVALQHLQEGRIDESLRVIADGIYRHPTYAPFYGVRGQIVEQEGDTTQALSNFERALELEPNNVMFLINRAHTYRKFGRYDDALLDLDKAIKINADSIPALFNRGGLLMSQNDYEGAIQDFEACIAVDPHASAPYFNRAIALDALGRRQQAIADIQRFLKISDSESWRKVANDLLEQWKSG